MGLTGKLIRIQWKTPKQAGSNRKLQIGMFNFIKKKANWFLLILEIVMAILGILSLADDVIYLSTRRETNAVVINVESLPLPDPYKVTFKYYNQYLHQNVTSYVDDIDGLYGETLPKPKGALAIYYRKYFPKEVYLVDYHHPNSGYVILEIVFLMIMSAAIYFQAAACRKPLSS